MIPSTPFMLLTLAPFKPETATLVPGRSAIMAFSRESGPNR
jgi:hypothetical protein